MGSTEYVAGIDPGKSGAVVVLHCPVDEPVIVERHGPYADLTEVVSTICHVASSYPDALYICEQIGPYSAAGRKASFYYGCYYGAVLAVLQALNLRYRLVLPKTWQKVLHNIPGAKQTKTRSVATARAIWPRLDWPRTKHGWADAALIAYYGLLSP